MNALMLYSAMSCLSMHLMISVKNSRLPCPSGRNDDVVDPPPSPVVVVVAAVAKGGAGGRLLVFSVTNIRSLGRFDLFGFNDMYMESFESIYIVKRPWRSHFNCLGTKST